MRTSERTKALRKTITELTQLGGTLKIEEAIDALKCEILNAHRRELFNVHYAYLRRMCHHYFERDTFPVWVFISAPSQIRITVELVSLKYEGNSKKFIMDYYKPPEDIQRDFQVLKSWLRKNLTQTTRGKFIQLLVDTKKHT